MIDWKLVEQLHQEVIERRKAEEAQLDELDKLVIRWQNMTYTSSESFKTFEYYVIQYCMLAKLSIKEMYQHLREKNVSLDDEKSRKAYEYLKNSNVLSMYD